MLQERNFGAFEPLNPYAWDAFSQDGEDGILQEVLGRLGVLGRAGEKWCVEFGAWDGVHLSNTHHLIRNHGFHAVMIEANKRRFRELCRNLPSEKVFKINRFVELEGENALDAILGETPIPEDFDLLSIDIDSCDYHVWKSLTRYRPKLVIIEFNPTIPVEVPYVQPPDFSIQRGNGVKAMDSLAREKGYTTICVHGGNLIAVRNDLLHRISNAEPPRIEEMADPEARRFLFVGYDGTILSNAEDLPMPWHPTQVSMEDLQVLPRPLRRFTGTYTPFHWLWFGLLDHWRRLKALLVSRG
ncbi:MAG: hypothetical protein RIG84_12595 [Roseovarius sp.]